MSNTETITIIIIITNVHVIGLWVEAGVPGENPCMQTLLIIEEDQFKKNI